LEHLLREVQVMRQKLEQGPGMSPNGQAPQFHQALKLDWEAYVDGQKRN